MIDFHCHVLPGLDDGPETMEESLQLCRAAALDGVGTIVATPHDRNGLFHNSPAKILEAVQGLRARLEQERIDLIILPGAELYADPILPQLIKKDLAMTANNQGRAALVEFPSRFMAEHAMRLVKACFEAGIVPVLAHPERCASFGSVETLKKMTEAGALLQVTALSLTGGFGKDIMAFTEGLIKEGLVHLVASDAHWLPQRPPILSAAMTKAGQLIGPDKARRLFFDNPANLLGQLAPSGASLAS